MVKCQKYGWSIKLQYNSRPAGGLRVVPDSIAATVSEK